MKNGIMNGNVNMKVNLEIFNGKELQRFIAIINQCENKGITDIRFVRTQIQDTLAFRFKEQHLSIKKEERKQKQVIRSLKICSNCGKSILEPIVNNEGLNIFGCRKCRYSEIREVTNGK